MEGLSCASPEAELRPSRECKSSPQEVTPGSMGEQLEGKEVSMGCRGAESTVDSGDRPHSRRQWVVLLEGMRKPDSPATPPFTGWGRAS